MAPRGRKPAANSSRGSADRGRGRGAGPDEGTPALRPSPGAGQVTEETPTKQPTPKMLPPVLTPLQIPDSSEMRRSPPSTASPVSARSPTARSPSPVRLPDGYTVNTNQWMSIKNLDSLNPFERVMLHNQNMLMIRVDQLAQAFAQFVGRTKSMKESKPETTDQDKTLLSAIDSEPFASIVADQMREFASQSTVGTLPDRKGVPLNKSVADFVAKLTDFAQTEEGTRAQEATRRASGSMGVDEAAPPEPSPVIELASTVTAVSAPAFAEWFLQKVKALKLGPDRVSGAKAGLPTSARAAGKKRKTTEEDEDEEDEEDVSSRPKKKTRAASKKVVVDDDENDDGED